MSAAAVQEVTQARLFFLSLHEHTTERVISVLYLYHAGLSSAMLGVRLGFVQGQNDKFKLFSLPTVQGEYGESRKSTKVLNTLRTDKSLPRVLIG